MKQTEKKIKNAFTAITPDILENVIRDSEREKGTVITVKKRRIFPIAAIATAAVIALLFGLTVGVLNYIGRNAVSSVVSIDVNPSVEIKLNKNDVVVEITALNGDGQEIIAGMKLEGSDVETALNALISSMLRSGYITELQNSVLIGVENDNNGKNQELRKKLNAVVSSFMKEENAGCAIITLKIEDGDNDIKRLADELGVSLGKAQIIKKLCEHNSEYTPESLALLNVNELTLLLEHLGAQIDGEVSGNASIKAYIGPDAAKAAAIEHLDLLEEGAIKKQSVSLDYDDGIIVYEVELITEKYEYEVEVNALNGNIVSVGKDLLDFFISEWNVLSEYDIKNIISKYGIPVNTVDMSMELQRHDGYLIYEVVFVYGGVEYEFEILATANRGDVITYKTKKLDSDSNDSDVSSDRTDELITEEKALEKALAQAETTENEIEDLKIELQQNGSIWEYDIEFKTGYYLCELKINAQNGNVIKYERDVHEKYRKLTLIGTTGNVYAFKMKINLGGTGLCAFHEIYAPMEPWLGYVDGSYGDPSFNEWITKYTEEWFENNRLFVGELIADGQIEIEGIYEKFTYNTTYKLEESQLLLVYNQLTEEERVHEGNDGTFYGYYFLLELPKEDYPEEHFTSGFGRGSSYLPEDATKYY